MPLPSVSPVFVGRSAEITALGEALHRAGTGEPQAVVVSGEAGVGKTRLLDEFLAAAGEAGAVAAVGGCIEIGAEGLPFAPISTILRALHRRLGDRLTAAIAGQEGELARLLPELGEVTAEFHDEDGRARLFELTARLLEALSRDTTLIIAVEDLHWADRSTRELFAYLLRSVHRARLVLLATYRSDDIHRRHPLRPFLAELDRLRSIRRVELPRLSRAEVSDQIAGIQGGGVPARVLVDEVFSRSEGNPFFVEELTANPANPANPAGPARDAHAASDLSDSLRDLLLVRVEALPEDAQHVVRLAAEGGSAVEFPLLAAVADMDGDALLTALRTAVGAHVLAPTDDVGAEGGYRFRHALVREAVSDDLLPGERSGINRRYAQALEAEPELVRADQRAARLASYWLLAHHTAKALPAALDAAVEARRRYAYAEQLGLLDRALELWEDATSETRLGLRPFDQAEVYPACGCKPGADGGGEALRYLDLLAETVQAALLAGERKRALVSIKRALRLLGGEDPLRAAWFWVQRCKLMEGTGSGDGWAELSRAQELVRGLPPSPVHAEVMAHVAAWEATHDPRPDNLSTAQRAVELAVLTGAGSIELHARITLGGRMVDAGDVEAGLAEMAAAAQQVADSGQVSVLGRAHVNLSSALENVGRYAEALAAADEGLAVADRYGLRDVKAWLHVNRAHTLLALGRWPEAEQAVLATRQLARGVKPLASAALRSGRLALLRGHPGLAAEELAESWRQFGTHDPQPQYVIPLTCLELEIEAARGRTEQVRDLLGRAVADGFPMGTARYAWPLLCAAVAAESDVRGLPAAEPGRAEALDLLRGAARRLPRLVPVWAAHGLLFDAELHRALGGTDAGRWTEAVEALERAERPYEVAQARLRRAEALLLDGGRTGREQAADDVRAAHAEGERLAAAPLSEAAALLATRAGVSLTERAADRTAQRGVPLHRVDPADGFGLTRREREVLCLLAAGRSNPQIAGELFISPKTVSVHVSRILAKLGVAGRGEAAALAHRLRLLPAPSRTPPPSGGAAGRPEAVPAR